MIKRLQLLAVVVLPMLTPMAYAPAQQGTSAAQAGPRIDATAAAMQQPDTERAMMVQARRSVGKPVALMLVGGAAIILGSIVIEGDIGTLFAIGGAAALLYGLYLYLR